MTVLTFNDTSVKLRRIDRLANYKEFVQEEAARIRHNVANRAYGNVDC